MKINRFALSLSTPTGQFTHREWVPWKRQDRSPQTLFGHRITFGLSLSEIKALGGFPFPVLVDERFEIVRSSNDKNCEALPMPGSIFVPYLCCRVHEVTWLLLVSGFCCCDPLLPSIVFPFPLVGGMLISQR
jgi:hypothetical protein